MTVKIITDKAQWENIIDSISPTALFQRFDWGEVQRMCGQTVYRFGYYDKNIQIGVAQAVVIRAKRGNFLHIRHGPIMRTWNTKSFEAVLSHLKDIAKANSCVCVRISPCIEQHNKQEVLFQKLGGLPAAIHAMDAEHSWVLDIRPSEEELLASMRKTTRYEIRHAQKMGVRIEKTIDQKSLSIFSSLYDATAKRHGFIEHQNIQEEFTVFSKANKALLIHGIVDKRVIASAIILFIGFEAIYHHGASESSSIPASYLVQWEAIREAKLRGMIQYNFWGIAPTDTVHHPWHGLTHFKKGFGGTIRSYMHAYDFPTSFQYRVFRAIEWLRKHYKGY